MNETNPYAAPNSDVSVVSERDGKFGDLDFAQLKKLYHRSSNVNAINFLLIIAVIIFVVAFFAMDGLVDDEMEELPREVFGVLSLIYGVAVIGIFLRAQWGRVLGIIACIVMLVNFPVGTLIGAFGLFAFFGAPELFGKDRITHRELKAEYKQRVQERKMG